MLDDDDSDVDPSGSHMRTPGDANHPTRGLDQGYHQYARHSRQWPSGSPRVFTLSISITEKTRLHCQLNDPGHPARDTLGASYRDIAHPLIAAI